MGTQPAKVQNDNLIHHRSSRWLLGILWENPLHMVKATYHGKNHGIWISPCNGLFHGTMAKPMDVIRGNIHGFCQSPLDFAMDHPKTKHQKSSSNEFGDGHR